MFWNTPRNISIFYKEKEQVTADNEKKLNYFDVFCIIQTKIISSFKKKKKLTHDNYTKKLEYLKYSNKKHQHFL